MVLQRIQGSVLRITNQNKVSNFSITPKDGYKISYQTSVMSKGKVYFNKDIPDGSTVKLDFYDSDENFVLTHTFVK